MTQEFQALLDACVDAVIIIDHRGIIQTFNRSAEQLFGYSAPEITGQSVNVLMPATEASRHDGYLQRYAATGEAHVIGVGRDVEARRRDGTVFPAALAVGRISGAEPPRFVGFLHDLTGRRQHEQNLSRSESLLREAQRIAQLGNFEYHLPTGPADYWSRELLRILGLDYTHGEFTLATLIEFMHPDDRERAQRDLAPPAARFGGGEFGAEYRIVRTDGQTRNVQLRWRAQVGEDGIPRYAGTLHDITERRQAEDAVRETQDRLTHVARLSTLGELTTGLAHELNQPLTAIALYAQAASRLATEPAEMGEVTAALAHITTQALRAGEIIKRLRALVKSRGTIAEILHPNEVIRELAVLAEADTRLNDVRLTLQLGEDLPLVLGDPIQLQQVLINLVRNAIEAMQEQSPGTREIIVRTGPEESGRIEFSVSDSGTGVDPAIADRLFDAFFTTKAEGTGLGLAISRSIIESHGGRLAFRARSPQGSCFYFSLSAETGEGR